MDQLADQASDLRSLYNNPAGPSPVSLVAGVVGTPSAHSPGAAGPHQHQQRVQHPFLPPPGPYTPSAHSPGSAFGDNSAFQPHDSRDASTNNKRKPDDDDGDGSSPPKQQRSKRNRYISIACNECKRRKIKCNGETPCQRCGSLNLDCLYAPNCCTTNFKDSDEFKKLTDHVAELQKQVEGLYSSMAALRQDRDMFRLAPIQEHPLLPLPAQSHAVTPSPSSSSIQSLPRPPLFAPRVPASFSGPTSINFTVDMAKNTLRNMGYSNAVEGQDESGGQPEDSNAPSPALNSAVAPRAPSPDPLWEFDKNEMVRLCQVHEEEVGIMYPVVRIDDIIRHAKFLARWMESARQNGLAPPSGQDEGIVDLKTCKLKVVMCCALVVESHGWSDRANRLYESVRPIVDRMLMSDPVDVDNLPFLALVAGYRFLSNEEILAWRVVGQVCRLCQELGLHRREGLAKIEDEVTRRNALMSFWSTYVLDRRWSFGTGLPYVFNDDMIDPHLPMPDTHPYLVAMITYSRLGAKIWRLVDYFEPAVVRELKRNDFDQLDNEILEWYSTVPEEIKVASLEREVPMPQGPDYNTKRLQVWTRLRLNQIRIWLHTPVLHSASSIAENMALAQRAVNLGKETIRFMANLNNNSNLYRRNQVFYHQFLTSAIAVLFLASTHAPMQFSSQCRDEFYMALELVKDMSPRSWVSQRLWRTVRSLRGYAQRLGLGGEDDQQQQRSGAASTAMADLASGGGGGVDGSMSVGADNNTLPPLPPPPSSMNRGASWSGFSTGRTSTSAPPTHHTPFGPISIPPPSHMPPHQQQQHGGEDGANGERLGAEMKAMFEGYRTIGVSGRKTGGPPMAPGLAHLQQQNSADNLSPMSRLLSPATEGVDGVGVGTAGVYPIVRELF